jgi:hypothetical protein
MAIRSTYNPLNVLVSILLIGALTSCKEEITDIGTSFLRDTVFTGSQTVNDLFTLSSRTKQAVYAQERLFNLNFSSPYLFIGSVPDESLEAWPILKVPYIPDSLGTITSVELVLSMPFHFMYGSAGENIEFAVYLESKKIITEGTSSLTLTDLDPQPVATFQGSVKSDSVVTSIRLTLDSARVIPLMRTTGLSVVLVPQASMKNIRAFASKENGATKDNPHFSVKFTKSNPDTTYTKDELPSYDFHLVADKSSDQPDQFSLRGAVARRERITINIKDIRSRLALDPYTTINSALLQFQLVSKTSSTVPTDTAPPVLVEISTPNIEDSAEYLGAYGTVDNAANNVYNFQIRGFIEQAIRRNQDSLVVELRTGFPTNPTRMINLESIGVEDYHLNRWTFYNAVAVDPLKRPRLSITYSFLR